MNGVSSKVVSLLVGLIAPVAVVVARLSWQTQVPDPMPTHWGLHGAVNGTTGATALFAWSLGFSVVLIVVSAVLSFHRRTQDAGRLLVALLLACAWLVAAIYVMTMVLSRHAVAAQDVALPWYAILLTIVIPVAVGVVIWSLLPRPAAMVLQPSARSPITIGASEKVVWISHAHSMPIRLLAVVLAVAAGVFVFFSAVPAVILLVVAVLTAYTAEITVRVDDQGLHTIWGPLGWPRQVIHLDMIAAAQAEHISPMKHGGWGYRITSGGTAANVRSGPGIVVQRTNGNTYVVTVDDAEQGVDILNALRVRGGAR